MVFCQCQKNVDVVTSEDRGATAMASSSHGDALQKHKEIDVFSKNDPTDNTEKLGLLPSTSSSSEGSNKENSYKNSNWENLAITLPLDEDVQPVSSEHSTSVESSTTDVLLAPPASAENIWDACEKGMLEEVKEFLAKDPSLIMKPSSGQDSESENEGRLLSYPTSRTPLYYASLGGHVEVMKYLMDQGAKDDDGSCYLAAPRADGRRLLLAREQSSCDISHETVERIEKEQKSEVGDRNGETTLSSLFSCCGSFPLQD